MSEHSFENAFTIADLKKTIGRLVKLMKDTFIGEIHVDKAISEFDKIMEELKK